MTKKLLTTLFLLLIAFVWTSALAQNARDAYNGIYQGQLIPQGKNVATGYDGPLDVLWDNGPMVASNIPVEIVDTIGGQDCHVKGKQNGH